MIFSSAKTLSSVISDNNRHIALPYMNVEMSHSLHLSFQGTHVWAQPYRCACEALPDTAVWGGKTGVFFFPSELFSFSWIISYWKSRWSIKLNLPLILFIFSFRSSTHSMCSKFSASYCGWPINIIITPRVYFLYRFSPSLSHFVRSARWACR